MHKLVVPMECVVIAIEVQPGDLVNAGQTILLVEAMKMQYPVKSEVSGRLHAIDVDVGQAVVKGQALGTVEEQDHSTQATAEESESAGAQVSELERFRQREQATLDAQRPAATARRHQKGYRTARENLYDLVDADSFAEYGQFAVAAQRSRIDAERLIEETATDGVIVGTATINAQHFPANQSQVAVVVNDYSVLAATQGYFHHKKLDRILQVAKELRLPTVMYTEGGGGRPGDTDVLVSMAGLDVDTFRRWAQLSGLVPRIAVNNGYCFAGNAALFGCADITIATKSSCIGMAGPAMIEGGGLGRFRAEEIGPIQVHIENGVVDLVAEDEAHATKLAKQCLSYFQGSHTEWVENDQLPLRDIIPSNRKSVYAIREVLQIIADQESVLELRAGYGQTIVTAFMRIAGRPVGVIANDCFHRGGALDAVGAEKASRFMQLCDAFDLPLVSLTDTPGFMVGPDSEQEGAVRRMSSLFVTAASLTVPVATVFLRRGYGLGAMAMAAGSFHAPVCSLAWPSGEFGAMGLEGAVKLGFKKELAAVAEGADRDKLFAELLKKMQEQGRAEEAAAFLEIDAVIDPAATRARLIKAFATASSDALNSGQKRNFVDTR